MVDEDGSAKPKYTWIDNVNSNDHVSVDYNQFNDFDDYISISFPKTKDVTVQLSAYEDPTHMYTLYSNWFWGRLKLETDELNLGLLNNYSDYYLSLNINDFNYLSRGPIPSSIKYEDYSDFKIEAESMLDYSLAASKNYDYSVAYYYGYGANNTISYFIAYYSPPGHAVHHDPLTPELRSKFKIPIEDMHYTSTSIMLSGESYENRLKTLFDPSYKVPATYQRAWLGNSPF